MKKQQVFSTTYCHVNVGFLADWARLHGRGQTHQMESTVNVERRGAVTSKPLLIFAQESRSLQTGDWK